MPSNPPSYYSGEDSAEEASMSLTAWSDRPSSPNSNPAYAPPPRHWSHPPSPQLLSRSWWSGALTSACLLLGLSSLLVFLLFSLGWQPSWEAPSIQGRGGLPSPFSSRTTAPSLSSDSLVSSAEANACPTCPTPSPPSCPPSPPSPAPEPLSCPSPPTSVPSSPFTSSVPSFVSLNHCRLLSLLRRLQGGEALRIAAIGGSVTRHIGLDLGYLELLTQHLNTTYPVIPPPSPTDSSTNPSDSPPPPPPPPPSLLSSLRSSHHSNLTFAPSHVSFNRGQSGTSSAFFSLCMSAFFPHAELSVMDLILVEFAINDLSYAGRASDIAQLLPRLDFERVQRGSYFEMVQQHSSGGEVGQFDPSTNIERLIRYVLTRHVGQAWGVGVEDATAMDGPAIILVESCVMDGSSAQAFHRPVAYQYGVMLISICEVLPHLWPSDTVAREAGVPMTTAMMFDQTHPNLAGHSVAAGMIMDRLLGLMDGTGDAQVQAACEAQDGVVKEVMGKAAGNGWSAGLSAALPSVLFPHNAGELEWHCTLGQFRQGSERTRTRSNAADMEESNFTVVDSTGWVYTDETGKGKWGWQTDTVNATLVLGLFPDTHHIVLAYLRTYQNIGSVDVWLSAGGWSGQVLRVDAWWERWMSTFELITLPEALMPPSDVKERLLQLHLRLADVGQAPQYPPDANHTVAAANRFKLVSIFQR